MAKPTVFKIGGFSRYYFTTDGKCFSDATGKELATEVVKWGTKGTYYRPINDDRQREVLYVSVIKDEGKKHLARHKLTTQQSDFLKGIDDNIAGGMLVPIGIRKPKEKYIQQVGRGSRPMPLPDKSKTKKPGWTTQILKIINALPDRKFQYQHLYEHIPALSVLFPENKNIKGKIRQQVVILCDRLTIQQVDKGTFIRK